MTTSNRSSAYVVFLLFLAYTFSFVDRQILSILFEPIKADLGLSDTQLGFLGGMAFAITYSVLGVPLAMLADRRGRKPIIAASLAIFSGMTVLCGMASSFALLALARVGVGIGEAGVNPASQSIIADLYPPERRSTPMSVVATGAPVGMVIGLVGGGFVAGEFGWRVAFYAVGMPGVILAALFWLTVREPARGDADNRVSATQAAPPLFTVLRHLWTTPSARYLLLGTTLAGVSGYGINSWFPAFFMRTHDLTILQVGLIVGLAGGTFGIIGALAGGVAFDRITAKYSTAAALRCVGLVMIAAWPIAIALFTTGRIEVAVPLMFVPAVAASFYLGPTNALLQGLVRVRMRAVAGSISMLLANLIGLGLGPQLVGVLSDTFAASRGDAGLATAMIVVSSVSVLSAWMFMLSARHVEADLLMARNEAGESAG